MASSITKNLVSNDGIDHAFTKGTISFRDNFENEFMLCILDLNISDVTSGYG